MISAAGENDNADLLRHDGCCPPLDSARRSVERIRDTLRGEGARGAASMRDRVLAELGVLLDHLRHWAKGQPLLSAGRCFAQIRSEARLLGSLMIDGRKVDTHAALELAESLRAKIRALVAATAEVRKSR